MFIPKVIDVPVKMGNFWPPPTRPGFFRQWSARSMQLLHLAMFMSKQSLHPADELFAQVW